MSKLKVGDAVKVLKNSSSHRYAVGKIYRIGRINGDYYYLTVNGVTGSTCITAAELEPANQTRAEKAAYLETEVLPKKKAELEAITKEVTDLEEQIKRYMKFPTAEEEAAHLISQIFKTGGDEAAILEVLKTTKVLTGKEDF